MTTSFTDDLQRVLDDLDAVLGRVYRGPLTGGDPAAAAAAAAAGLAALWERCRFGLTLPHPAGSYPDSELAGRFGALAGADFGRRLFGAVLPALTAALTACTPAEAWRLGYVVLAHAPREAPIRFTDLALPPNLAAQWTAALRWQVLPENHPLRQVLSAGRCFTTEAGPMVLLGPVAPNRQPWPFYRGSEALAWTAALAGPQIALRQQREREALERRRLTERAEQARPLTAAEAGDLRRRLAEAEARERSRPAGEGG